MKKIKMKFGGGIIKALKKKAVPYLNSDITTEDIREWKEQLEASDIRSRKTTFHKPMGLHPDTGGLYRIADGVYCNKAGYERFEKELMRKMGQEINNYSLPKTFLPTNREE